MWLFEGALFTRITSGTFSGGPLLASLVRANHDHLSSYLGFEASKSEVRLRQPNGADRLWSWRACYPLCAPCSQRSNQERAYPPNHQSVLAEAGTSQYACGNGLHPVANGCWYGSQISIHQPLLSETPKTGSKDRARELTSGLLLDWNMRSEERGHLHWIGVEGGVIFSRYQAKQNGMLVGSVSYSGRDMSSGGQLKVGNVMEFASCLRVAVVGPSCDPLN